MTSLIGQSLGRYHILEQLGQGGMATVYKAYDTRLERDVAIKVILPQKRQTEKFLQRFERETKSLAGLSHPNIVKVLDYGEKRGLPYLVMEYLPGGTLKQKFTGKPLPWQEAARILIPIAHALHYAHQNNIIHRDVKPANIMFTEAGHPMLTDFGVAKILEEEITMDLTGTNGVIGTPEYMSPEQAKAEQVDARSDLYSLGVVFYEMVAGRKPYIADTPMAVLIKQATEPLPGPRQFVPGLPGSVERVLVKALTKRPGDRYPDLNTFAQALESLVSGTSPGEKPVEEIGNRVKGKKYLWLIPVVILGIAILCGGGIGAVEIVTNLLVKTTSVAAITQSEFALTTPTNLITEIPVMEMVTETMLLPTASPSPSQTATIQTRPLVETFSIGRSVQGRDLEVTRVGTGSQIVVIVGQIHGNEPNSADLVRNLWKMIQDQVDNVGDQTFYFLPLLNPDGGAANSRFNANGVDLNRNWDTLDWQANTETSSGVIQGGGGSAPLSEPESKALASWLLSLKGQSPDRVILFNYQSLYSGGLVIPGFTLDNNLERVPDIQSVIVGQRFANQLGFGYSIEWTGGYKITAAMVNWCADSNITCLDIELPSRNNLSTSQVYEQLSAILYAISP